MRKLRKSQVLTLVLILCLTTTCFISGTIAKYIVSTQADDSAQVAKWGVLLSSEGSLFDVNYFDNKDGTENKNMPTDTEANISVKSSTENKMLAPGTKGETLTISLLGETEVRTKVTVEITTTDVFMKECFQIAKPVTIADENTFNAQKASLYTVVSDVLTSAATNSYDSTETYYVLVANPTSYSAGEYYPITYKLTRDIGGEIEYESLAAVKEAIYKTIDADYSSGETASKEVAPNTNLANEFGISNMRLTWEWTHENSKDAEDTYLGFIMQNVTDNRALLFKSDNSLAVAGTDYNFTASFDITVTVEQVD